MCEQTHIAIFPELVGMMERWELSKQLKSSEKVTFLSLSTHWQRAASLEFIIQVPTRKHKPNLAGGPTKKEVREGTERTPTMFGVI